MKQIELKEKEQERQNVLSMWSQDVAALTQKKNFDEQSKKGQKALRKVADKYAPTLVELEDEIAKLEKEIAASARKKSAAAKKSAQE